MNAQALKDYLIEDIERIEKVIESVGCHGIWRTGDEVRACTPNGTNHTQVSVNTTSLYSTVYLDSEVIRGDIYTIISHFRDEKFSDSFKYIKSLFGISSKYTENKIDPLATFKSIRGRNSKRIVTDINNLEVAKFGDEALSDFVMKPHLNFFYEGITIQTQELFNVGYDPNGDRIVIPHYSWDDKSIVGVTGRTLRSSEEQSQFKIPKYFNYIKGYKKMYNLYGFSHSIDYILRDKYLIIFEAEKSVQKEFSMTRNEGHGVSTGGHEISDVQVQIILQNTPIDVEVVIAYDKDIMALKDDSGKDIGEDYLKEQCMKFSHYRRASYIFDKHNILGEKDSPVDKGVKIWNHLFKYRQIME